MALDQLYILDFILSNIQCGTWIAFFIYSDRMDYELFVSNDLIDMYAESGDMKDWVARIFFDSMVVTDLISWNFIIKAYELNEQPLRAFLAV